MDFGSVLHVAQKNEKMPKKEVCNIESKLDCIISWLIIIFIT